MRGALVSTIYRHGNILSEFGTTMALAMERVSGISEICIFTTDSNTEGAKFRQTTKVIPMINSGHAASYLKLYHVMRRENFDVIVINSMPTSQGPSLLSNLLYLLLPILLPGEIRKKVRIVYHNSPFLNDIEILGYRGLKSRLQTYVLKLIERRMFRKIKTVFLLEKYAMKIKEKVPDANVSFISSRGLAAFSALYLNGKLDSGSLPVKPPGDRIPTILLYGFWGPQKDLITALKAIQKIRQEPEKFKTVLAGGINVHFQKNVKWYENILTEFHDSLDVVLGYIEEDRTVDLFLESDIIILPYRAVGGFSGVLSHAMFFGLRIIVPMFDEYIEQCGAYPGVIFIPVDYREEDIVSALRSILSAGNYHRGQISPIAEFSQFVEEFEKKVIMPE